MHLWTKAVVAHFGYLHSIQYTVHSGGDACAQLSPRLKVLLPPASPLGLQEAVHDAVVVLSASHTASGSTERTLILSSSPAPTFRNPISPTGAACFHVCCRIAPCENMRGASTRRTRDRRGHRRLFATNLHRSSAPSHCLSRRRAEPRRATARESACFPCIRAVDWPGPRNVSGPAPGCRQAAAQVESSRRTRRRQ